MHKRLFKEELDPIKFHLINVLKKRKKEKKMEEEEIPDEREMEGDLEPYNADVDMTAADEDAVKVDYACTPEEVQQHFQSCGTVNKVTILTDKHGQPKCFACVEFLEAEAVQEELEVNESELHGHQLKVLPKRTNVHGMKQYRPRPGPGGPIYLLVFILLMDTGRFLDSGGQCDICPTFRKLSLREHDQCKKHVSTLLCEK
ncbi:hypothetical protein REPUB_Repub09cG0133200 [Reevesia pubescens]